VGNVARFCSSPETRARLPVAQLANHCVISRESLYHRLVLYRVEPTSDIHPDERAVSARNLKMVRLLHPSEAALKMDWSVVTCVMVLWAGFGLGSSARPVWQSTQMT